MLTYKQKLKLCGFALGIFGCFTVFGLAQEKIFRGRYGNETDPVDGKPGERYRMPIVFGLIQGIFYASFAKGLILATNQPKNESPQTLFALAALFYVLGKFTSHLSLQWVPYPTQIVGKASKPIPVMLLGVLIGRKKYTLRKVIFVLMIVFGVILFIFKDKYEEKDGEDPLLGSILIGLSLLCDGLCGATEDRMRSIAKPTALNFMHYLALWSTAYHAVGAVALGEIPKFFDFVTRHPDIIKYFAAIVCVGALGQIFISSMLSSFGALPLSIATTTRKFFSVILSVIIYQNSLSLRQWIATGIIFGTLMLDGVMSKTMAVADTAAVATSNIEQQPQTNLDVNEKQSADNFAMECDTSQTKKTESL